MNEKEEQVIDLRVLWTVLTKYWLPIAAAAVAGAVIAFVFSAFAIDKQYTSTAMLYVENNTNQQSNSSVNVNDINAAQKIVETCQIIFKSDYIMGQLSSRFDDKYSTNALKNMINIQSVNSTQVLSISVTNPDPEQAKKIADEMIKLSQSEFLRVIKGGSIEVVSNPGIPMTHSYPNEKQFTLIGFMLGLVGVYAVFLVITLLDKRVKPDDDLSAMYGIPVFAEIMSFENASKATYSKYAYYRRPKESASKEASPAAKPAEAEQQDGNK